MKSLLTIAIALLLCGALAAQSSGTSQATVTPKGDDFSGMYSFLQDGEFVQINLEENGAVTGFISRYGELESDKGAFLDQFLKNGRRDGNKIEFSTDSVHGTWFQFSGVVNRGPGKDPNQDGYFVMQGKLTKYTTDSAKKTSAQARDVTFKSFPQDAGLEPPRD